MVTFIVVKVNLKLDSRCRREDTFKGIRVVMGFINRVAVQVLDNCGNINCMDVANSIIVIINR